MEAITFQGFPKIARLNRDIIITEKIDGTNAQVIVTEDGQVAAASRTQLLTLTTDNFGFARWVHEHEDDLRQLGPGRHFGEWWGQGIQRRYGLTEKRLSLFNVSRWNGDNMPSCVSIVPVMYTGPWGRTIVDACLAELSRTGSAAAPGFRDPEGVVVYHTAANVSFKVTLKGDEQPKGQGTD